MYTDNYTIIFRDGTRRGMNVPPTWSLARSARAVCDYTERDPRTIARIEPVERWHPPIEVRYMDLTQWDMCQIVMLPDSQRVGRLLSPLGIEPQPGEEPLRAWIRTMCEENDLEYDPTGTNPHIGRAVEFDAAVSRFIFALA